MKRPKWERKEHNRKTKWIDNREKEFQGFKEVLETIILESPRATLKKVPNWEMPGHDGIHVFWF